MIVRWRYYLPPCFPAGRGREERAWYSGTGEIRGKVWQRLPLQVRRSRLFSGSGTVGGRPCHWPKTASPSRRGLVMNQEDLRHAAGSTTNAVLACELCLEHSSYERPKYSTLTFITSIIRGLHPFLCPGTTR